MAKARLDGLQLLLLGSASRSKGRPIQVLLHFLLCVSDEMNDFVNVAPCATNYE
jgi:hypothetical protein